MTDSTTPSIPMGLQSTTDTYISEPIPTATPMLPKLPEVQSLDLSRLENLSVSGSSTIQVLVFVDKNHNGNQGNGEKGLKSVWIELVLVNEETEQSARVASGETDPEGMIIFQNLPAGTYRIRSYLPKGYLYGEKANNVNTLKDSIMERQSAPEQESASFQVEEETTYSAGIGATPAEVVTGRLWIDLNGDGREDKNEPGLGGQMIEMEGQRNELYYQTETDQDGYYRFTQIREGAYRMHIVLPEEYRFTRYVRSGPVREGKSRAEGNREMTAEYRLSDPSHRYENENAGVYIPGTIEGFCFQDADGNGLAKAEEAGVAGVTVRLISESTGKTVGEFVTEADGKWHFENLMPGAYTVQSQLPRGEYDYSILPDAPNGNQFEERGNRRSEVTGIQLPMGENVHLMMGILFPTDE